MYIQSHNITHTVHGARGVGGVGGRGSRVMCSLNLHRLPNLSIAHKDEARSMQSKVYNSNAYRSTFVHMHIFHVKGSFKLCIMLAVIQSG